MEAAEEAHLQHEEDPDLQVGSQCNATQLSEKQNINVSPGSKELRVLKASFMKEEYSGPSLIVVARFQGLP